MFRQKVKGIILDFKLFSFQGLYSVTKLHPWIICAGGSCHSWRRFQCFTKGTLIGLGMGGTLLGWGLSTPQPTGPAPVSLHLSDNPLLSSELTQLCPGSFSLFLEETSQAGWLASWNSWVVEFLDWEGRDVTALMPASRMAVGTLFTTGLQGSSAACWRFHRSQVAKLVFKSSSEFALLSLVLFDLALSSGQRFFRLKSRGSQQMG